MLILGVKPDIIGNIFLIHMPFTLEFKKKVCFRPDISEFHKDDSKSIHHSESFDSVILRDFDHRCICTKWRQDRNHKCICRFCYTCHLYPYWSTLESFFIRKWYFFREQTKCFDVEFVKLVKYIFKKQVNLYPSNTLQLCLQYRD